MKKSYLTLILFFGFFALSAQTFSEVVTDNDLPPVIFSALGVGDLDGDQNEDLFIQGLSASGEHLSNIFLGNGDGTFEFYPSPFYYLEGGTIDFEDLDGDGDLDMLRTGAPPGGDSETILYFNDGNASFTEAQNDPFASVSSSSVDFGDVNGDSFPDILLFGDISDPFSQDIPKTGLYLNDGKGNFTEANAPFIDAYNGSVHFLDANGDSHLDAFIAGQNSDFDYVAKLYLNDGTGNFTEALNTNFLGANPGYRGLVTDVADYNQDGLLDIFILASEGYPTVLYLNDGTGNFTPTQDIGIFVGDTRLGQGISLADVSTGDVNRDGSLDLLIAGEVFADQNLLGRRTKIFLNDGTGNFKILEDTPFEGGDFALVELKDFNNDNLLDVLMFVRGQGNLGIAKVYLQDEPMTSTENLFLSSELQIYPNPIEKGDGNITISINTKEKIEANIQITDIFGKVLKSEERTILAGYNNFNISIAEKITSGTYFLTLIDKNNKALLTSKLIKL